MGEAKRRREARVTDTSTVYKRGEMGEGEFTQHCTDLRAESGPGLYRLELFPPERIFELLDRAASGEPYAAAVIKCIPASVGNLCLLCDRTSGVDALPDTLAMFSADVAEPTHCIGNAICPYCVEQHSEDLRQAVYAAYCTTVLGNDAWIVSAAPTEPSFDKLN